MLDFRKSVVYQIYTKSFRDTSGNGLGDIRGIIQQLDYIHDLDVDYIWPTPFFQSPQRDNGYDISDYLSINPDLGTMEDVEELIAEADKRGIGMMFDMVFNHTSTEHEWFQRALTGDPKYMAYYIFRDGEPDTPPTNWQSKFGGNAWEYVPHLKKWYLHLYDVTQADLNWDNPEVREELKHVVRFWKKKGVKGFRFDVVNLISKPEVMEDDFIGDGRRFYTDGPHIHEYLHELVTDAGIQDMITVGEMSSTSLEDCIRYSRPENQELSMVFSFHHLKVDYKNGRKWELQPIDYARLKQLLRTWQLQMQEKNGWNALFWSNHDQPRVVSRFGDDTQYWKQSAKMLSTCMHMMRGTPYIFQGEELGMPNANYTSIDQYRDVESINYYHIMLSQGKTEREALQIVQERSRDNARTPMQWSAGKNAGFSEAQPWISIPDNYVAINAEAEQNDPDSILNYHKQLIALRKQEAAISDGKIDFLFDDRLDVLAYRRYTEQEELLVFNNLTSQTITLTGCALSNEQNKLLGNYEGIEQTADALILRPYESMIYRNH